MGKTTREGASGSLRRKSGDRPDARHWAFPAAQGEPGSFLAVLDSIHLLCGEFAGMVARRHFMFQQSASVGIQSILCSRI
jgi:hypothetical protein